MAKRFLIIIAVVLYFGCNLSPREKLCAVTEALDGDTIKVMCEGEEKKAHLLRLRTPFRGKNGYEEAVEAMNKLVVGKEVRLEFEKSRKVQTNYFGDYLCYVFVDDLNVNIEMVRLGYSTFWTHFGAGRFADEFLEAEREARSNKRGIWASNKEN